MEVIFKNAVNEISKVYVVNAIDYVKKTFPKLYEKSITAENKVNRIWDEGRDLIAFSEAVREWEAIHMKFIELSNTKILDTVVDDVYNPCNGKPDPDQGLGKEVG